MGTEIERKFLVVDDSWRKLAKGELFKQGFLSTQKERVVRVRVAGQRAWLTVKGVTRGVTRLEYEYAIPVVDALLMLDELCEKPLIEKTRYKVPHGGFIWEVDDFMGENKGLLLAEVELPTADTEFERPPWVGEEVSDDPRYFNANLVQKPFKSW